MPAGEGRCGGKAYYEVVDSHLKSARLPVLLPMSGLPPMKKTSRVQDGDAAPLPPDPRVQETNQAARCFRTFMDFLDCRHYLSEENDNCAFLKQTYNRICPSFWTEQWYEQLKKGTHPAWEEPPPPKICDVCPKEE